MVNVHQLKSLNPRYLHNIRNTQQGVVLVVSLVFLIALTAVGAAIMQNTTTDMKMSGASQEKSVALQEAMGEIDRVIYNQVRRVSGKNAFALPLSSENFPYTPVVSKGATTSASIEVANAYNIEPDCPRSRNASSNNDIKCSFLRVRLTRQYGRANNSDVEIHSGIVQEFQKTGN